MVICNKPLHQIGVKNFLVLLNVLHVLRALMNHVQCTHLCATETTELLN